MVGAAADELHHVGRVAQAKPEHIAEKRKLLPDIGTVDNDVRQVPGTRYVDYRPVMLHDTRRNAERLAVRGLE
jgi:hypothetical protein